MVKDVGLSAQPMDATLRVIRMRNKCVESAVTLHAKNVGDETTLVELQSTPEPD